MRRSDPTDPTPLDALSERRALERAYVPEHVVRLMTTLSGGRAYSMDDHLLFAGEEALILVGYPLDARFSAARAEEFVRRAIEVHRPRVLRFIGPELPPSLAAGADIRESDCYYAVAVADHQTPSRLVRIIRRAKRRLFVNRSGKFTPRHRDLIDAFRRRRVLPPAVDRLYQAAPEYVARTPSASVLSAWDHRGRLHAFAVVETAAPLFDAYLLGAHSRDPYVPHASDLLLDEMIRMTAGRNKPTLHLGRGVSAGIRRFKEKWGGQPGLPYAAAELRLRRPSVRALLRMWWEMSS